MPTSRPLFPAVPAGPVSAALAPEHVAAPAAFGYADEAPFGDIVKDPTPVPSKPKDQGSDDGDRDEGDRGEG